MLEAFFRDNFIESKLLQSLYLYFFLGKLIKGIRLIDSLQAFLLVMKQKKTAKNVFIM